MAQQKEHIGDTNKMITAVEWFIEQCKMLCLDEFKTIFKKEIEQAKTMEKEQIINAWIATDNELQRIAAEEYYNDKFKK